MVWFPFWNSKIFPLHNSRSSSWQHINEIRVIGKCRMLIGSAHYRRVARQHLQLSPALLTTYSIFCPSCFNLYSLSCASRYFGPTVQPFTNQHCRLFVWRFWHTSHVDHAWAADLEWSYHDLFLQDTSSTRIRKLYSLTCTPAHSLDHDACVIHIR